MQTVATIELETPIKRGEGENIKEISSITLRKPKSGELRGLNLTDVLQMDVIALSKLTPRISEPTLTPNEVESLDIVDLLQIGTTVAGFLLRKEAMKEVSLIA